MDDRLIADFIALWGDYFPSAALPLAFYYTDQPENAEPVPAGAEHRCLICDLAKAIHGTPLSFDSAGAVCGGAKRYLGFSQQLAPNFEYFLSCGIPGKLEGELYKKSPELVKALLTNTPQFTAPARYAVFKRWDLLQATDDPVLVIFFATPDVLSGLFTLAGFETAEVQAVIAPFAAGCGSIVMHPYLEFSRESPRAVLGMFDVSARPCVPAGTLSFTVPMPLFEQMVANMDQSFLITDSWSKVRRRIGGR